MKQRGNYSLGQFEWGTSPWGAPPPPITSAFDGPSQVTLTVKDPVTGHGVAGAEVSVALFDFRTSSVGQEVLSGVTNRSGTFSFTRTASSPNTSYRWRITVSQGLGSPSFAQKVIDVPARTVSIANRGTRETESFYPIVNVCLAGTDPLVCDVAEAQLQFRVVYEQQLMAWNYESTGRQPQIARNAADQAHAAVRFTNPRLNARWETYSWWVGDAGIPPADWPALLDRVDQVTGIFNAIPFPTVGDYFIRCARGIPINLGMSIANPRFYTDTFNGEYWPREDWSIEVDMAMQYQLNQPAILNCIKHKIKSKVRDVERSAKAWRMMSLASTFILAPLAAGAMPTLLVTEAAEFGYQAVTGRPGGSEVGVVATSGVSAMQADPSSLAPAIQLGLERLISEYIEEFDPRVQQVIMAGLSELAAAAAEDVVSGIYPSAVSTGTLNVPDLASAGSSVIAVGIKLLGRVIAMQGVRGVESLQEISFDLQRMEDDPLSLLTFWAWASDTIIAGVFLELGTRLAEGEITLEDLGISEETPLSEFDMEDDIWEPLIDAAENDGLAVPRRGDTGDVAVIAGIGVGALLVAGLGLGIFGD